MAGSARLTSVVLAPSEVDGARARLQRLVEEASADAALLLLRSGEIAVSAAERPIAQADTLGALLAANFASAREIARLLGEGGFESQFQQGVGRQVVTHAVGDGWLLAVVFEHASSLGMVRMLAARAAEELAPTYQAARQRALAAAPSAGERFRAAAADQIDSLFGEKS